MSKDGSMKRLLSRKLVPVYGILILLAIAFASPALSGGRTVFSFLTTSTNVGTQQSAAVVTPLAKIPGNNCGIKGDGTHDHGKTCPNYPYPGH
jgi:hypothetical protein